MRALPRMMLLVPQLVGCGGDGEKADDERIEGEGEREGEGEHWLTVSAGGYHICGITSSDRVECWGWDEYDQASPPSGTSASVSAGGSHTCGVVSSGSVECWGKDDDGQSSPPDF